MSRGVNKVILCGHMTAEPDIRYTTGGSTVANFSIATNESWRDKNSGEKKERTEFHRVVILGKAAEFIREYTKKGTMLYIEGQNQTRDWEDNNGVKRYITEVVVRPYKGCFEIIKDGKDRGGNWGQPQQPAPRQQQQAAPRQQHQQPQQPAPQPQYNEPPMDFDDDIPFAPIALQHPMLIHCM